MAYDISTKIFIKTAFKGTHNWPEASEFAGPEVDFLEARHRHTFHVKAELQVSDLDREVEFFVFQNQVDQAINVLYPKEGLVHNLGRRSCEMIATEIIGHLREIHKGSMTIEVWEDNEVGASVNSNRKL